ncbi:MAG: hypothetical protein U0800_01580 [Isosphaeraceae bacterium]
MPRNLADATLASLPIDRLDALESLRGDADVVVAIRLNMAWVSWDPGGGEVMARLLPVPGVRFYTPRDSEYHTPGRWLPSLEVPSDLSTDAFPLARSIVPEPIRPVPPGSWEVAPIEPSLAGDEMPRPCTAWLGALELLNDWADRATTAEIASLRGATCGERALVIGDPPPLLPGGGRFWGRLVLCPLGRVVRPWMTDRAWAEWLGLGDGDRAIVTECGIDVVPGAAIGELGRAAIRLAYRGVTR